VSVCATVSRVAATNITSNVFAFMNELLDEISEVSIRE